MDSEADENLLNLISWISDMMNWPIVGRQLTRSTSFYGLIKQEV